MRLEFTNPTQETLALLFAFYKYTCRPQWASQVHTWSCWVHSQQMHMAGCIFLLLSLSMKGIVFPAYIAMPYGCLALLLWKANQGNLTPHVLPDSAAKSGKWWRRCGEKIITAVSCGLSVCVCGARVCGTIASSVTTTWKIQFWSAKRGKRNNRDAMRRHARSVRRLRFCKPALLISPMLWLCTMRRCAARHAERKAFCHTLRVAAFRLCSQTIFYYILKPLKKYLIKFFISTYLTLWWSCFHH